jgi:predicted nucleic acid-binding protein
MAPKKVYWDTSCFISFLSGTHADEIARQLVCDDILKHARNDEVEIWTSVWSIVETIRPKTTFQPSPVPLWAELLKGTDKDGNLTHPEAEGEFEKIWTYYKRNTLPTRLLSDDHATRIKQMFDWPWIRKIQVIPAIAHRAAEIARSHNMKAGDALHVASAIHRGCDVIHRWDKDFKRTDSLIQSCDPVRMSPQTILGLSAPEGT